MSHYISHSPEESEAIGAQFAATLRGGECVGLSGPLGAGKTRFMHGVAKALPLLVPEEVASPSFSIINHYPLKTGGVLYHIDMYRLDTWKAFQEIDGEFLLRSLDTKSFVFIEWSNRYRELLPYLDWTLDFKEVNAEHEMREIAIQARAT